MLKHSWILLLLFSFHAFAGPVPADEVKRLKPSEKDPAAQEKCQALSDDAKARGVSTLVIAFEGWNSFYEAENQRVYAFLWQLGHEREKPTLGRMGAGVVLVDVILPLVRRFEASFEYLLFSYAGPTALSPSVPEICALEWMKEPGRRLALIGHSFGGDSTVQIADKLEARSLPLDYVLTLDPVAQFGHANTAIHRSRNAKIWDNYHQDHGWPTGNSIEDADVNMLLPNTTHIELASTGEVQQALRTRIGGLISASRSGR